MAFFDIAYSLNKERKYPRWATEMSELGYDWDAVEATTDDGYVLTMFNVHRKKIPESNLSPILVVHDLYADAASWLKMQRETDILPEY